MSINTLLKLDFFKSLGFASKENGMEFIKCNPKLQSIIQSKVEKNVEQTHLLLEDIQDIFSKFDDKKEIFIMKTKCERGDKLLHKKDIQKQMLKEEMRNDILQEIQNEQEEIKVNLLETKYPKCIPKVIDIDINSLNKLFIQVITKIDNGEICSSEMKNVEKAKDQVEKALAVLMKSQNQLQSILN